MNALIPAMVSLLFTAPEAQSAGGALQRIEPVVATESQPAAPPSPPRAPSVHTGSKGSGHPQELSVGAKAVMDRFRKALRRSAWDKALSCCSPEVRAKAKGYATPEKFFLAVVPIGKLLAEPQYRFWTTRQRGRLFPQVTFYACFLRLMESKTGPTVSWEWSVQKAGAGWEIDFKAIPVDEWIKQELDRQQRQAEERKAKLAALEPKLVGLRTQLTGISREYVLGKPMVFRLELINDGKWELSYDDQQVAVNGSMIITRTDGTLMPYIAQGCQTSGAYRPIGPGQTVTLFDGLDLAKDYAVKEPGRYKVQFGGYGLSVGDGLPRPQPGWPVTLSDRWFPSNVVEIEVRQ
jgi:hypothetical protein